MTSEQATRLLHTRGTMIAAGIVALGLTLIAYAYSGIDVAFDTCGLVAPWVGCHNLPRLHSMLAALGVNVAVLVLMVNINKAFNLLRTYSSLLGTFFIVLQLTTPMSLLCLSPGVVMSLVALVCVWLLYSLYAGESIDTRKVFLLFAILSACMAIDVRYIVLFPVFFIGCMQMQVFTLRSLSAIVLGIATPWMIMLGFGIVAPTQIRWPEMPLVLATNTRGAMMLVVTASVTGFVTLAALLQNVMKIMTYNAHSRAMLGVITTLTLVILTAAAVNSANIAFYLPLLNCCCAMQLAHLFGVIYTSRKSYIAVLSVAGLFLVILLWKSIVFLM